MATLSELIAQHCAALGDDYPAIAARLNAPTTIDNPVTEPPQVPHPPTLKEIYAIIPVAEAAAIYNKPGLSADIRNAIDSGDGDGEYLQMMLAIVLELGIISQQTATALALLLARTQPDPAWTATIAGPSLAAAAGVGTVTAAQVQAVLA